VGDPYMANSEASQANFVASVYLVGRGPSRIGSGFIWGII